MVGRAAATGLPRGDERARDAPAAADERAGGVVDGADAVELSLEQPGKGHYRAQPATVDSSKDEGLFVTATTAAPPLVNTHHHGGRCETVGRVSPGFRGRRSRPGLELPPGQYLVEDFPVLSAGPTPRIDPEGWEFVITNETGQRRRWDWAAFRALPTEPVTTDIHCVTKWSKLGRPGRACRWTRCLPTWRPAPASSWPSPTVATPPTSRWRTCATARPGSRSATAARTCSPNTAGRRGCWCRTCTFGRAPSGCGGSGCWTATSRAFGRASATTTTVTRGASSGTGATDLADRRGAGRSGQVDALADPGSGGAELARPCARPARRRAPDRRGRLLHPAQLLDRLRPRRHQGGIDRAAAGRWRSVPVPDPGAAPR